MIYLSKLKNLLAIARKSEVKWIPDICFIAPSGNTEKGIVMVYFIIAYFILVAVTGFSSIGNVSWDVAASGFICPLLALFAGSGLRGSLYGDKGQKTFGLVMACIFFAVSSYWISSTGFYVSLYNVTIGGGLWVIIGLLIGFIFTTKKYAVSGNEEQDNI